MTMRTQTMATRISSSTAARVGRAPPRTMSSTVSRSLPNTIVFDGVATSSTKAAEAARRGSGLGARGIGHGDGRLRQPAEHTRFDPFPPGIS
jgi:hypothetical protein